MTTVKGGNHHERSLLLFIASLFADLFNSLLSKRLSLISCRVTGVIAAENRAVAGSPLTATPWTCQGLVIQMEATVVTRQKRAAEGRRSVVFHLVVP